MKVFGMPYDSYDKRHDYSPCPAPLPRLRHAPVPPPLPPPHTCLPPPPFPGRLPQPHWERRADEILFRMLDHLTGIMIPSASSTRARRLDQHAGHCNAALRPEECVACWRGPVEIVAMPGSSWANLLSSPLLAPLEPSPRASLSCIDTQHPNQHSRPPLAADKFTYVLFHLLPLLLLPLLELHESPSSMGIASSGWQQSALPSAMHGMSSACSSIQGGASWRIDSTICSK
eukprot:766930-Hanusia_phi.AAC.4